MKKSLVVLSVLSLFSMEVFAENNLNNTLKVNTSTHINASARAAAAAAASAKASSASLSKATATGGSVQSTISNSVKNTNEQNQSQSTENSNNAKQSVNISGDNFQSSRIPVSTAYAPSISPSSNCRSGSSGGVQFPGFGLSIGGDTSVDTCEINEAARIAVTVLGDNEGATYILCQNKWAKVMPSCIIIANKTPNKNETHNFNDNIKKNPLIN